MAKVFTLKRRNIYRNRTGAFGFNWSLLSNNKSIFEIILIFNIQQTLKALFTAPCGIKNIFFINSQVRKAPFPKILTARVIKGYGRAI